MSFFLKEKIYIIKYGGQSWETGVPRENHWQTLSHNVVSSTPRLSGFELITLAVMCTDCIGSYKSNYHTVMTAHHI
jgi:hypothetical protein